MLTEPLTLHRRSCMLLLAAALASGPAAGAIYKWVDEKGVTQYSEKPPQGKKSAEVPIRSQSAAPVTPPGPQGGAKTWQEQEAEFRQRRAEQEEQRLKKEAQDRVGAADRLRTCLQARQDLHVLEQQRPVYTINAKGERVFIEDKDRDQYRERMRRIVEQTCDR